MCGRYASARSVDDLASTFGIAADDVDGAPAADWNIAPTKPVPAVIERFDRRMLTTLRWGLIPSWADAVPAATLFNARIETVADKPAFRDAIRRRRCLLPAEGWYEWARLPDGRRIPHFLTSYDGSVVALAGLWDQWTDAEGRVVRSAAILTGAAPDDLAHVHDRAPVVVDTQLWAAWLDERTPFDDVVPMLRPTAPGRVRLWPVSDRVGDVSASGPDLAAPVQVDEQPALF